MPSVAFRGMEVWAELEMWVNAVDAGMEKGPGRRRLGEESR